MLSTGIPELQSEDDLEYLRSTLRLDLTDKQAAEYFTQLIYQSLNTKETRLNFLFHMWAHNKWISLAYQQQQHRQPLTSQSQGSLCVDWCDRVTTFPKRFCVQFSIVYFVKTLIICNSMSEYWILGEGDGRCAQNIYFSFFRILSNLVRKNVNVFTYFFVISLCWHLFLQMWQEYRENRKVRNFLQSYKKQSKRLSKKELKVKNPSAINTLLLNVFAQQSNLSSLLDSKVWLFSFSLSTSIDWIHCCCVWVSRVSLRMRGYFQFSREDWWISHLLEADWSSQNHFWLGIHWFRSSTARWS